MAAIAFGGDSAGFAIAAATYSAANMQYRLVHLTTAATPTVALSTASSAVFGVMQNTPVLGEPATVQYNGISRVRVISTAHTAIVPGTLLRADGSGGATPSAVSGATGDYIIGTSLEILSSTTTGIIGMLITHQGARGSTA